MQVRKHAICRKYISIWKYSFRKKRIYERFEMQNHVFRILVFVFDLRIYVFERNGRFINIMVNKNTDAILRLYCWKSVSRNSV